MRRLLSRRTFLTTVIGAPVLAGLYTWRVEPTWLEFVRRDLPITALPDALVGRTLIQLSDVHIGPQVSDEYLVDTFKRIAALKPDLIVHTGDLITYAGPQTVDQARGVMGHFPRGRLGTFAILGNHDYGRSWADPALARKIAALLAESGCTVLRNTAADVSGLQIVGLDDLWAGRFAPAGVVTSLTPNQPALVLSHNPDTCDLPGWGNFQGWILAGHTHGGQCKPPFLPPPMLPVKNRRYTSGEFDLSGNRRLYINRGVGHLLRVRFNARPEVTVFTLKRA